MCYRSADLMPAPTPRPSALPLAHPHCQFPELLPYAFAPLHVSSHASHSSPHPHSLKTDLHEAGGFLHPVRPLAPQRLGQHLAQGRAVVQANTAPAQQHTLILKHQTSEIQWQSTLRGSMPYHLSFSKRLLDARIESQASWFREAVQCV
jgi:hypothetical protein